jgi:hypothetical protein
VKGPPSGRRPAAFDRIAADAMRDLPLPKRAKRAILEASRTEAGNVGGTKGAPQCCI